MSWHLHTDRPERCLGGSDNRAEWVQLSMQQHGTIVCESNVTPEACQAALDVIDKHRKAAAGEKTTSES